MSANSRELPITVVVPAYNAERFIKEALASVWAQSTLPREVVVVDDGSTDRTGAVANACGAILLRQANQGLSSARNTAIRVASQPWIALLDADDVWEPAKLERQWAAVEKCPDVDMVFTDFFEFDDRGAVEGSRLRSMMHYAAVRRTEIVPGVVRCERESLQRAFFEGNFIAPSTVMVRRDLIMSLGLFDTTLSHVEDREMWLRLLNVATVAVAEQPLMRARIHDANWSSDHLKMALGAIEIARRIFANPDRYPPGAVDRYRAQLPYLYLLAGNLAEQALDLSRARGYYWASWRLGRGARPLAFAILTHFPLAVRSFARSVARRLVGSMPATTRGPRRLSRVGRP